MEINDETSMNENLTMEGLINQVGFQIRRRPSKCVTVSLGLLFLFLLAGNIVQIIYHGQHDSFPKVKSKLSRPLVAGSSTDASRHSPADPTQPNYGASTAESKQLETRLSNLTQEKDQLQQSYNTLKQERDQLQTNSNGMQMKLEEAQRNYSDLQRENDDLQTLFNRLQSDYYSLRSDNNLLKRRYNALNISKIYLQASHDSLQEEIEELETEHNNLQSAAQLLQTHCSNLVITSTVMVHTIYKLRTQIRTMRCQTGWYKLDINCYFVSTEKKNWLDSRQDCIAKGTDLVIIDSRAEQAFINTFLGSGQNAWIGLTDILVEGNWTWVDKTPVTTAYWEDGQPNSFNGNQDCGEFVERSTGVGEWNDEGCSFEQIYICEQ